MAQKERSLATEIWTLMTIPLVLVVVVGGMLLYDSTRTWWDSARVARQMSLVQAIGAFVDEQQKERGATSIFLNSGGTQFVTELREQRQVTDAREAELREVLDGLGASDRTERIDAVLNPLMPEIARRTEVRAEIDGLQMPLADALGYYTQVNADALSIVGVIGSESALAEITAAVSGMTALLTAKERAGIERAVASGGFAKGMFDTPTILRLQTLIAQQELSFDFFRQYVSAEHATLLADVRGMDDSRHVREMRAVALAFPDTGDLGGITGQEFFEASSARIVGLRSTELRFGADIVTKALALRNSARNHTLVALAVICIGAGFIGLLARRSVRNLASDVRAFTETADRMSGGDLEAEVPASRLLEMTRIGQSLVRFRQSILDAQGRDAVAREERERLTAESRARDLAEQQRKAENAAQRQAEADRQRAHEAQVAQEISRAVTCCARGDFTHRIDLAGKSGVLADICSQINDIGTVTNRSLTEVTEGLRHLADGDLTYRLSQDFEGIFAEIAHSANRASDALSRTVTGINQSAQAIRNSTGEIGDASADLARRSEQNAAVLEETASALEEMAGSISAVSGSSSEARTTVERIATQAESGYKVVQDAITAMDSIRASSERIERVLQVIDDIAFQTNLLALNAGVEAARAGEAGRGFAVVASEVRALAQRSSEASREIADMIQTSSNDVNRGVEMVNGSGSALEEIVSGVRAVRERIQHIADAARETELGIREITKATNELDRTTQQNAAMFEETNAAITTLRNETGSLVQEVSMFRTVDAEDAPITRQSAA